MLVSRISVPGVFCDLVLCLIILRLWVLGMHIRLGLVYFDWFGLLGFGLCTLGLVGSGVRVFLFDLHVYLLAWVCATGFGFL